ncbi:hypothetical protein LTR40_005296, partial [Exophiala xenobiotica]
MTVSSQKPIAFAKYDVRETLNSTSESRREHVPLPSLDLSVALSLAASTRDDNPEHAPPVTGLGDIRPEQQ